MKNIILATDYSKSANNAMEYAALLAQQSGAKLTIINSFHLALPVATTNANMHDVKQTIAEKQKELEHFGRVVSKMHAIVVDTVSTSCPIEEELNRQVFRLKADLVVLGAKGNSLSGKLFGRVGSWVMKHAYYPLLIVPMLAQFAGFQNILLAYEKNCITSTHTLTFLKELVKHFKSHIKVLHVGKESQTGRKQPDESDRHFAAPEIEEMLEGVDFSFKQINTIDVVSGIQAAVVIFGADLVVMVPHKLSAWESIFNTSKTRQMALSTHVPLLVLPNIIKQNTTINTDIHQLQMLT